MRRLVQNVQSKLPKGAMKTEIDTRLIDIAGMIIALSGENYTYSQLESFSLQFKDELGAIEGID